MVRIQTKRNVALLAGGIAVVFAGFGVATSGRGGEESGASAVVAAADGTLEPKSRVNAGLGPEWDLPNLEHPRVDYWIDRFQHVPAMRKKFQGFLDRGTTVAPVILARLEARGMPQDLLYLAMIESGFQTNAHSRASAVGVWQFIQETGERYGLEVDRAVDERRDPIRATDAALDYLEDLHDRFGSWYLAAAAYNTGENRVGRLMRAEFGTERASSEQAYYRIWDALPRETRDYVPLMIAAARITKDPAKYGFKPLVPAEPQSWDEVTLPPATSLGHVATTYGTTVSELKKLNPQFKLQRTPNDREYVVRLPAGALARYAHAAAGEQRHVADE